MLLVNRNWLIVTAVIMAVFFFVEMAKAGKPDRPGGGGGGGNSGDGDTARFSVIELPFEGKSSRLSEPDFSGVLTIAINASRPEGLSAGYARVDFHTGIILSSGYLPEPTFVDPGGGFERDGPSEVSGVNSFGQVVGSASTFDPATTSEITNVSRATLWDFDGTNYSMMRLSELPNSAGGSAYGINSQGDIVGTMYGSDGDKAVYWDSTTLAVTDLNTDDTAALGWELRSAEDINDDEKIVGWGKLDEEFRGFVLDYETQDIAAIPLANPAHGNSGVEINSEGRVTGSMWDGEGKMYGTDPDFHTGFSWESSGVAPEILPSVTNNTSWAIGMNDADATVGNSVIPTDYLPGITTVPTLWKTDEVGVIQAIDLRYEIPDKPNYTLTDSYDINNDGWITASGRKRHKGQYSWPSLLLVPNSDAGSASAALSSATIPEPSTFALLILGTTVVAAWRRKANGMS